MSTDLETRPGQREATSPDPEQERFGGGLYNPDADSKPGIRGRLRQRAAAFKGALIKHKWLWGIGGAGVGLGGIFIVMILFAGTLMIPNLAENIVTYQFARVFRDSAKNNSRLIGEKVAIDASSDSTFAKMKQKYDLTGKKVSEKWSKFTVLQPNKVITNMGNANELKFNYGNPTVLGRQRLTSITMNGATSEVESLNWAQRNVPIYRIKGQAALAGQFQTTLKESLRANEVGPITRGLVAKELRSRLGIGLVAWNVAKYKNMKAEKARIAVEKDAAEKIRTTSSDKPATEKLASATEQATEAETQAIADDKQIASTIANDGTNPEVEKKIGSAVSSGWTDGALSTLSSVYAIAVPVCIVFDGSISHSGSTVDSQSAAQQKAFYFLASAADQQKDGVEGSEVATGALNEKLGDPSTANALVRASGNQYTTSNTPGGEVSAGGSFTLFNAIFGGGDSVKFVNAIAENVCPTLTDPKWAVVGGLASLVAGIFSGGTSEAATVGAGNVARHLLEKVVAHFAESILKNPRQLAAKVRTLGKDTAKSAAKVTAVTLAAKLLVASRAGYLNDGLEQGSDFVNMADSGANIHANEIDREQFYGRPLTAGETKESVAVAMNSASEANQQKSTFQRYLALNNPQSLLSATIASVNHSSHQFSFSTALSGLTHSLSGSFSTLGSISTFSNRSFAYAAETTNAADLVYTNVQFGWTTEENNKINGDSWHPLENQLILDNTPSPDDGNKSMFDAIDQEYGDCFKGDKTMGALLESGDISRNDDGNVNYSDGHCSPKNLSDKNDKYGDYMLRWRLAKRDDAALATLNDEQTITQSAATEQIADTSFRIASFNVRHIGTDTPAVWEARLHRSVDTLLGKNSEGPDTTAVDVAGLQEMRPGQIKAFNTSDFGGDTYDMFPTDLTGSGYSPNPIIWNKTKFNKISTGSIEFTYFFGSKQQAPLVKLQSTETGQIFYVINTHDPADAHGPAAKWRLENATNYADQLSKLASDGYPIFFTGDFNSHYDTGPSGNPAFNNQRNNLTYCVMTQDGSDTQVNTKLWDVYDASQNKQGHCPSTGDATNHNSVDHIFLSRDVTAKNYLRVPSGPQHNGSDVHDTLMSDITIHGSLSSGSGTQFRAASYNVHTEFKITPAVNSRIGNITDNIKLKHYDVVGLQELEHAPLYNLIKNNLSPEYDIYPATDKGSTSNSLHARAVAWRKDKFQLVKSDEIDFTRMGNDRPQPAHAPILWLKDVKTGQEIIFINTHNPAYNFAKGYNGPQQRYDAGVKYVEKIKELQGEGLPIVFTGDFNEGHGVRFPPQNSTLDANPANLNYCMLATINIIDAGDTAAGKKAADYCNDKRAPMGEVDHIYISSGIQVQGYGTIQKPASSSDHISVYADLVVPGSGGDGAASKDQQQNGWVWPIAKSDYTGLSECWNASYDGGRHAGQDIQANSGTRVYAAHDGVVSWYKYDSAGGNILLINAGNGLWYNYQHLKLATVHAGDTVKAGQFVAVSDNSGSHTTGPHLHFGIAVYNGVGSYADNSQTRNPLNYLPKDRDISSCQK